MPPKGQSRRSTRGAKPSGGPDSSASVGAHSAFKDDEPVKPRRGAAAKARTASYQLDDGKPAGRGSKLGARLSLPAQTRHRATSQPPTELTDLSSCSTSPHAPRRYGERRRGRRRRRDQMRL